MKVNVIQFFLQLASTVLIGPWPSLMDLLIHRHLVRFLGWGISPTQNVIQYVYNMHILLHRMNANRTQQSKDKGNCSIKKFSLCHVQNIAELVIWRNIF
jgi:hypothetical protein